MVTITTFLVGSISKPCFHAIWPKSIPKGVPNIHFLMFNDIRHFLHLSNINYKTSTWSFNRLSNRPNIPLESSG
jgi:hypothetical protein